MDRKLITNMDTDENDDLSAVNMVTLKKFSSSSGDIDLQDKYNVKNSKQQNVSHLSSNYDNLVSYDDVKNIFLSRKETFPMETGLDMGNQTIFNVKDPTVADHGVNKGYVDAETIKLLALSGGTMTGQINMGGNINVVTPTYPTDAANKVWVDKQLGVVKGKLREYAIDTHKLKDEFRYLMEDVNESSSENGIRVDSIVETVKSPHKINKKAYNLKLTKNSNNRYISILGFNMYKLPEGEYTICVEFFPFTMANLSVNAVSSSLNIGQQTTSLITKGVKASYSRPI